MNLARLPRPADLRQLPPRRRGRRPAATRDELARRCATAASASCFQSLQPAAARDGAGECRAAAGLCRRTAAPASRAGARGAGRASGSATARTTARRSFPAASSSASRSPGRWSTTRADPRRRADRRPRQPHRQEIMALLRATSTPSGITIVHRHPRAPTSRPCASGSSSFRDGLVVERPASAAAGARPRAGCGMSSSTASRRARRAARQPAAQRLTMLGIIIGVARGDPRWWRSAPAPASACRPDQEPGLATCHDRSRLAHRRRRASGCGSRHADRGRRRGDLREVPGCAGRGASRPRRRRRSSGGNELADRPSTARRPTFSPPATGRSCTAAASTTDEDARRGKVALLGDRPPRDNLFGAATTRSAQTMRISSVPFIVIGVLAPRARPASARTRTTPSSCRSGPRRRGLGTRQPVGMRVDTLLVQVADGQRCAAPNSTITRAAAPAPPAAARPGRRFLDPATWPRSPQSRQRSTRAHGAAARRHRVGLPARRRHRHHEHHAGLGDRADARDRHPHGRRRPAPRHPAPSS